MMIIMENGKVRKDIDKIYGYSFRGDFTGL